MRAFAFLVVEFVTTAGVILRCLRIKFPIMQVTESIKILARAAATVLARIVAYLILGIVLNLILLSVYWSSVANLWSPPAAETAMLLRGAGALTLAIVLLSPLAYLILGKKQGISAALYVILDRHRVPVIHYLLTRFFARYPELLDQPGAERPALLAKLADLREFVGRQSFLIRLVLQNFLSQIDFAAELDRAMTEADQQGLTGNAKLDHVSAAVSRSAPAEAFEPGWQLPALVIGANVGLVWLINTVAA